MLGQHCNDQYGWGQGPLSERPLHSGLPPSQIDPSADSLKDEPAYLPIKARQDRRKSGIDMHV